MTMLFVASSVDMYREYLEIKLNVGFLSVLYCM